jgi:hypothetical protein
VSCRAGFRARALLVGGAAEGLLADVLTEGWAYPSSRATIVSIGVTTASG